MIVQQEFNIYKAGEEQAKEVCGPLMDLESQCKEGLATQAWLALKGTDLRGQSGL